MTSQCSATNDGDGPNSRQGLLPSSRSARPLEDLRVDASGSHVVMESLSPPRIAVFSIPHSQNLDRPVLVLVGIRSVKVGLAEVPSSLPAHSTSAARSVILPVTPGGVMPNKRVTRAQSRMEGDLIGGRGARMAAFAMVRR
jgi:hypothetical protein